MEEHKEPSYAFKQRQRTRTGRGQYAKMNTCESCGKRIGDDYYSRICAGSGAGLVLCGKCCTKLSKLSDEEAEKLMPYSPYLRH